MSDFSDSDSALCSEKEKEVGEVENEFNNANANFRHLESTVTSLTAQLKQKRDEFRCELLLMLF